MRNDLCRERRTATTMPALANFIALSMLVAGATQARAGVWQWSCTVPPDPRGQAFLWIPPDCQHVRGVIVGAQVILEKKVFEDPAIRAVAAERGLAILLFFNGLDSTFNYSKEKGDKSADNVLQATLDRLADESGYSELSTAPLLPIGHSGAGILCANMAHWNPKRVISVVTLHAAAVQAPAWDDKSSLGSVPFLAVSGEYESWGNPNEPLDTHWRWLRGALLLERARHPSSLVSEVVDPGAGHFSFSPHLAQLVSMFIGKTVDRRVPALAPATTQPVALNEIPVESGWLTDITLLTPSQHKPATYDQFTGDRSLAFWHVDEEMARAVENFREDRRGKADQRVTFVQDGKPLPAAWITDLPFEPSGDGMTMKVAADFLTETPQGVSGAGKPLGHSMRGPIRFELIGGWGGGGERTGSDTFRIRFDEGAFDRRVGSLILLATHEGDETFAYAEQAAQIKFPVTNKAGAAQTISFEKLPESVASSTGFLELKATATSGLPVEFFVRTGPAEIVAGTNHLKLLTIPPRAKFPVVVKVVAHQWGRIRDPAVASAEPVEQVLQIEKR